MCVCVCVCVFVCVLFYVNWKYYDLLLRWVRYRNPYNQPSCLVWFGFDPAGKAEWPSRGSDGVQVEDLIFITFHWAAGNDFDT